MPVESNRPRVFVSSTIADFADLRSALKCWLEELGLVVLESEYTDFERRPDADTFNSCFEAIGTCHYYILLVGGRRGSWYDEAQSISVTQQEFRVAAQLAREGKITPIVFIRQDVMTALEERRALARARIPGISPASRVLNDPEFTERFVREIEQTQIERLGPDDPAGTLWHYRFAMFRQIVDALRVALRLEGSVTRQNLLANLKWELNENLSILLMKTRHDNQPLPLSGLLGYTRRTVKLVATRGDPAIRLNERALRDTAMFCLLALSQPDRLRDRALLDAISSGQFLLYNPTLGRPVPSSQQTLMYGLRDAIERCRAVRASLAEREIEILSLLQASKERHPSFDIRELTLAHLFRLQDEMQNVVRLSVALLRYIRNPDSGLRTPQLHAPTPYEEFVGDLEAERIGQEDVERWVTDGLTATFITGERWLTQEEIEDEILSHPLLQASASRLTQLITKHVSQHADEFTNVSDTQGPEAAVAWLDDVFEWAKNRLQEDDIDDDYAINDE